MLKFYTKQNFLNNVVDESLFRKLFIMTLSFEMLAFVDIAFGAVKCILLMWGLFILINNYFLSNRILKIKYKNLLIAFLVLMIVTSAVHFSIWFIPNIVLAYCVAVCFFMFYGMYTSESSKNFEKEMIFLSKFFVYFGLVGAVSSIATLFWQGEYSLWGYHLGIYCNRLIGIYTNSNILAFSMIECIVAGDILLDKYMRKKIKLTCSNICVIIFSMAVSCVCLFLSDSNASMLFLIIYSTIRVLCGMFFRNKFSYTIKFVMSIIVAVIYCIFVMIAFFALRDMCQSFIGNTITGVYRYEEEFKSPEKFDIKNSGEIELVDPHEHLEYKSDIENIDELTIGRHEHYDVSSGRITLFKQGLEIFKRHPIIGIGRANLIKYGKKYIKGGLINLDLHNAYFTILVSTGIIGLGIFLIFSVLVALDVCKHLFFCYGLPYFGVFSKLFSALVAYCGYCLLEKAIIFDMTFMVGFFWSILAYTMCYMNNKN